MVRRVREGGHGAIAFAHCPNLYNMVTFFPDQLLFHKARLPGTDQCHYRHRRTAKQKSIQ